MATWVVGDVQGCCRALERLLALCHFDPAVDRLWLVGDLVNRGPQSLEVLRLVTALPEGSVTAVLGNHDLYALMRAAGVKRSANDDTLDPLFAAPDRDRLLDWLRARPLLVWDERLGWAMAHAGIPPVWDWATAVATNAEVVAKLAGDLGWLKELKGGENKWHPEATGMARLRYIVNGFTRMRFVHAKSGALELKAKGPPQQAPKGTVPWFRYAHRVPLPYRVVFGHWSLLGFYADEAVLAVDTSCVYGGRLTAVRLDDLAVVSVACGECITH
ncbi:symmetrical bis(5'-nucleosyl)-tetraphosphatase [Hydrogenophilus islandicus]